MHDQEMRQDVRMIRTLMEDSQRVIHDNGKYQITWGVLISAALVLTYAALVLERPATIIGIWGVALVVGWALSFWFGRNERRRASVNSPAARILGGIWLAFGITAGVLWLLSMTTGVIAPAALSSVMAALLGLGYFATSFACASTWMRAAAVAWWGGAVVMAVWPGIHVLLVFAGMLIALQVVPNVFFGRRDEPGLEGGPA